MLRDNVLDTLVIKNSEIVYKKFHLLRTQEAFRHLKIDGDFALENIYSNIENNYAPKIKAGECLRIIFFSKTPLQYHVEIKKIEQLNPEIKLSTVVLKKQPSAGAAYKWENREGWNLLLAEKKAAADDILVVNSQGEIVETSRFNIFYFSEGEQKTYTPELNSGCLNGVLRRFLLDNGFIDLPLIGRKKITEKNIKTEELDYYQLFVGNSVRGVFKATLI